MSLASPAVLVLKIGGSLAKNDQLERVIAFVAAAKRAIVIVPGGGEFADTVRDLQSALALDNRTAHRLAMLGMHQMAEVFCQLDNRLLIVEGPAEISAALETNRVPVWVPLPMLEGDETIPATWDATSDALAARLAERLGNAPVVLLKSAEPRIGATAEQLADDGLVDPCFPTIVARSSLTWRVFGPSGEPELQQLLADPDLPIAEARGLRD